MNSYFEVPLWKEIKRLRKEKGYTQQVLADMVGCYRQEISNMENGRHQGSIMKVIRVLDALDSTISLSTVSNKSATGQLKILAIDDDPSMLESYRRIFSTEGQEDMNLLFDVVGGMAEASPTYEIDTVNAGKEGVQLMMQSVQGGVPYDLVLLDMRMPNGWDGLKTAHELRKISSQVPIIIISGYSDYTLPKLNEEIGGPFMLQHKPCRQTELLQLAAFVSHSVH